MEVTLEMSEPAMLVNPVQPEKAYCSMDAEPAIFNFVMPVQFEKADCPIEVTLLGSVIVPVNPEFLKALFPMEVTVLASVKLVRFV